ncbi:hypothetical protein BDY21DRAFT_277993 [Lineolata rhizophorae]|uniref:Uncharacterized protein n=1 Tax=Lineolata rhizophorae TaxID=578093 RepID=A0A6A6PE56_9PEZI|nr:hypothetical protein BDY21DRAFT_277993 [Lineolata rhizophorae]
MAPIQLSFPLPHGIQTRIHVHLTIQKLSVLLFLTTVTAESSNAPAPMGSFVCAMPNRTNATAPPLSSPLYTVPETLDFTTRVAKIVAWRSGRPTYVGSSMSFVSAGLGGTVDEEMEGLNKVIEVVMGEIDKAGKS